MAGADKNFLIIPFKEFLRGKLVQDGEIDEAALARAGSREFENYKAIEMWGRSLVVPPIQTFHWKGALALEESDVYWVPAPCRSMLLTGGVSTYGSGTATATINKNGTAVGTISMTARRLFVVAMKVSWAKGDAMTAEITGAGTGCSGLELEVLR